MTHSTVSCPERNLYKIVSDDRSIGGHEGLFSFSHPKDAQVCNRPQRGQGSEGRPATIPAGKHKECLSLWRDGYVGLLHNLHKFGAVPRPLDRW